MSTLKRYAFLPYVVIATFHFVVIVLGNDALVAMTKPLLMPILLLGFLAAAPVRKNAVVIAGSIGIVFSWAGDVLLQSPEDIGFLLGLGAFFFAQISFIVAFLTAGGKRLSIWAGLFALWWIGLVAVLAPHLGALLVPVGIYGLVLGAMATLSTRLGKVLTWGGALFLASDTMLALDRFLPDFTLPWGDELIMSTYMIAEGLIAYGLVQILRKK